MGCDNTKFKTSEASSKARLRTQGVIDKFLNILDYPLFNKLNNKWSDVAKRDYSVEGKLFYTNEPGTKAIPNKKAFKTIDNAKGIYYSLDNESSSTTERGSIGFNKQQILRLLGPTMYNKPIAQVAVKELLQNSFDAVKTIQNLHNTGTGKITIDINAKTRTIKIEDDGIGMTPDIVKNAFLSIGGTNKEGLSEGERSGGLGLAKVQFLMGSESIKVETVRDGIKTIINATNVQLYNDDFDIITQPTTEKNGSKVEVKIPASYTTMEGQERNIDFPGRWEGWKSYDILQKPLIGDVNVYAQYTDHSGINKGAEQVPIGANSDSTTLPPLFSNIDFDWGTAELYMSEESTERPKHRILSSGIYQFDHGFWFKDYEDIPYDIVVNIKPKVSSSSEQYPFNNQREGFKNSVSNDIAGLNSYLKKYASGEAEKALVAVFSDIKSLPKVDPNVILTPEERAKIFADVQKTIDNNKKLFEKDTERGEKAEKFWKNIAIRGSNKIVNLDTNEEKDFASTFRAEKNIENNSPVNVELTDPSYPQYHNNTNIDYLSIPGAAEFFTDFGNTVLQMVRFAGDELGYDYSKLKTDSGEKFFAGVSIDKTYGGVHIRKVLDAIFVNPLAFYAQSIEEAIGIALHVTIHEINHTTVSGEGASFTTALGILYGKIYGTGKYGLYEGLFRSVYQKHFETYKNLRNEYTKSTTRNLSEAFNGENIQTANAGNIQGNEADVQSGQSSEEGFRGNTIDSGQDKTGDVILSQVGKILKNQNKNQFSENSNTVSSKASPETIKIIKDFMKRAGIDYNQVNEILADGKKVNANAVAKIFQQLIEVVQGKEATALPEEAMHFAVELIQQNDPTLFKKLLNEINSFKILQQVYAEYGNNPFYQTSEGKPDVLKLKKEAIAKLLAEIIIKNNDGITSNPELLKKVDSWWQSIINFFKGLISKSGFDTTALKILSGEEIGNAKDLRSGENDIFLQEKDPQTKVYDKIKEISSSIELRLDPDSKEGKEAYFKGNVKIGRRVSDIIQDWYGNRFANKQLTEDEFDKAISSLKAEKGTDGHSDLEHAFNLFVDENGYLKSAEERKQLKINDQYRSRLNPTNNDMYYILRDNIENRLLSYGYETRFLSEFIIYDEKRDIAGTVDFAAIDKEGNVNILDWKFMDLNVDKYKEVPWFKVNAWNQQMDQYKYIISNSTGLKNADFKHTRMIPIKAYYSRPNKTKNVLPSLLSIEIGDVNVKNITSDYLLPVGLEKETTGNSRVDNLLEKLNAVYKKLSEGKALPSERSNKNDQLNALFKAIRQLQMKQNIAPLIRQAKVLNVQIEKIIQKHEMVFKGKDANIFEETDISEMAGEIETAIEAIKVYLDLDQELNFLFKGDITEEDKKLKEDLRDTVSAARDSLYELELVDKDFIDNIIGKSENVKNLSSPEKIVKGIGKIFGTTATLQLKSLEVLYKKANKVFGYAAQETRDELIRLRELKDAYTAWASGKSLTNSTYFNIIKKKDKNELIDEFNPEFYKEFKDRAQELNYKWIRDNIDVPAYKEYLEKKLADEILRLENKSRIGSEEEMAQELNWEIEKAKNEMDTSREDSFGWLRNDAKKFPLRSKWESKSWIELNRPENKPALDFYNYIKERNEYYKEIGYIHAKQSRVFLPWVRKGLSEKLIFGGNVTIGEQFLRNITIDESDIGYGQIDPLTGKPVDVVPVMLTKELKGDYSTDLFKTMGLYNEFAIKFKYLTDIESQARALIRLEKNKKAIATSIFGKTEYKNNIIQLNPDNTSNTQLVESMVKSIIYQQQYISNESFDQVLGHIGKQGEKINKALGFKMVPKNLDGRVFSVNKAITQINNSYQVIALGLNVLSATSNLFGGSTQSLINSGKYFTKAQFTKTELWLLANKMNGESKKKNLAALEYFMPFTDNFNREYLNKLSISKLTEHGVQDFLMSLMKNSDSAVQTINFFSYFRNSIVMDNKVINAREYLRTLDEYQDMYIGTLEERTARADKFEKDANELVEKFGVAKLSSVVDGKLVIPGVERKSDSVLEVRRKVQQFTSDALGNLSEENKRLINMNVYGKSIMVFKNWIPRLVDVRTGNLKYNSASDAYEWGRSRMVFRIISEDLHKSLNTLISTFRGTDAGIERLRKLYEDKKADYEKDTGKILEMTESEFIELARKNIQNQVWDTMLYLALFSLYLGVKAVAPDDDEDQRIINQHKFLLKATDKLLDEVGYFYNPANIFTLVSSGVFPATGLISNYAKALDTFGKEMYGLAIEDDKLVEKNHTIKYWMKSFPVTSQIQGLLPMFWPDLAKDLGIRAQSKFGVK